MFVLEIRPETREVVVGTREESFNDFVEVGELNWLAPAPDPGAEVRVQLRHRARDVPARVTTRDATLHLELEEEVAAVTPGQSAVVFDAERGERVLGGGRIVRAGRVAGVLRSASASSR
jgi:tRNA-specific 2-thiouridylase